ncbi:MAG: DUF6095 family protein [Flavobacteriaceae bacterium]|jgi:hypothetical protein
MNKELLFKGLQRLFVALIMAFTGPVIYSSSLKNEEHPLFIPVLVLGIGLCFGAIYFGFKGIALLVKGFFNEN